MNNEQNTNPLLDFSGLPRFDLITAAHVTPAVDILLEYARAAVERVAMDTSPATWDNVVEPLAEALLVAQRHGDVPATRALLAERLLPLLRAWHSTAAAACPG